jgi:predicted transcriptional regulator
METTKHTALKTTANTNAKTTQEIIKSDLPSRKLDAVIGTSTQVNVDKSKTVESGAVKNDSNAIKSTLNADSAATEKLSENSFADKDATVGREVMEGRSKMDIATEIYKQMMKTKGITRKEILEKFMTGAKLSKAGSSTYFQLIKAKFK